MTGSTGDGLNWAKNLGHKVIDTFPALVPIKTKEEWVKELQGLSLKNVEISVFEGKKKKYNDFGECLFTHFGMSGPVILNLSKRINELLRDNKKVKISIDLKPALTFEKLEERILRDFKKYQNRSVRNCFDDLLPSKMIPIILKLSKINKEKKGHSVTKNERKIILSLLKKLEVTPLKTMGFNSAIVTSGGVSLKEIDDKTMRSKLINNLFFAGEVIDIDGPTGGYNLQNSWSTGHLAGKNSAII